MIRSKSSRSDLILGFQILNLLEVFPLEFAELLHVDPVLPILH